MTIKRIILHSDIIRGLWAEDAVVQQKVQNLADQNYAIYISAASKAQILSQALTEADFERAENFVTTRMLEVNEAEMKLATGLRKELVAARHQLPFNDILVLATALHNNMELYTHDKEVQLIMPRLAQLVGLAAPLQTFQVKFQGHSAPGTAVIRATNKNEGFRLLQIELAMYGLLANNANLTEADLVPLADHSCTLIYDGNPSSGNH